MQVSTVGELRVFCLRILLLGLLVMVCAPSAMRGQVATAARDALSYPVAGTVLNSLTHEPIARVLVQLNGNLATLTDNEGHFEFPSVPPGLTGVQLRRPGYRRNGGRTRSIEVGRTLAPLTFTLTPEATLSGQLTLTSGDSAEGIRVTLYRRRIVDGRGAWRTVGVSTTNSEGVYRFADLDEGTYTLYTGASLDRDFAVDPSRTIIYGYPMVCYPGVADLSQAAPITLAAGQHGQADFAVTRQAFYPVTATVTNVDPGASVSVQVVDRSGNPVTFTTRYDPHLQTVSANLPNGTYNLVAHSFGLAQSFGETTFTVSGAPANGIRIAVLPLHAIRVNIHRDFTAAANSGNSTANRNSRALHIELLPAAIGAGGEGAGEGDSVQPDGDLDTLLLENVQPGSYWVHTSPTEGYVASISSGGVDLTREPLEVGAGGTSATIEATLRDDSATLTGTVSRSPSPASGTGSAFIYLLPLFSSAANLPSSVAGANGQFAFSQVPPGSYRVVAFDSPQDLEYRNAEAMQALATTGKTITLEPGGTAAVQLDVMAGTP